jgi:hypothetical protein
VDIDQGEGGEGTRALGAVAAASAIAARPRLLPRPTELELVT